MAHEYSITVRAEDWNEEDGWSSESEFITAFTFGSYDEAIDFLMRVTEEQVIEWQGPYNALDIALYKDIIKTHFDGTMTPCDSELVAEAEWINGKLNGIWEGFNRIR